MRAVSEVVVPEVPLTQSVCESEPVVGLRGASVATDSGRTVATDNGLTVATDSGLTVATGSGTAVVTDNG